MVRISVHGTASRSLTPERGTVQVAVVVTGEDRRTVLSRARQVHAEVLTDVKRLHDSGAVARWSAPDVSVWAYLEWVPVPTADGREPTSQQRQRFRAGAELNVEFTDLRTLGEWAGAVAERDGAEVRGIEWDLAETTWRKVTPEVRGLAAQDAVARARDYADALTLGAPRLLGIFEQGLHPGAPTGAVGISARSAIADMKVMGGPSGFELRPEEIQVEAAVTAEFEV